MNIHWIHHANRLKFALVCIQPNDVWVLSGDALTQCLKDDALFALANTLHPPICLAADCLNIETPSQWLHWSDAQLIDAIAQGSRGLIQW